MLGLRLASSVRRGPGWLHPRRLSSYYETIQGLKYDRTALDAAREAVAGRGDGRVSLDDARLIAASLKDGPGVTKVEFRTAFKILNDFNFTDEARKAFVDDMAHAE